MSEQPVPDPGAVDHAGPAQPKPAPETGIPPIDDAVASLQDLADAPLSEHHDRLAGVHAALDEALHPDQYG